MGGSSPNSDSFLFGNFVCFFFNFFYFIVVVHVSKKIKKMDRAVGGWGLANPSFSRIFYFFLT